MAGYGIQSNSGFTLVELVVVILIVGVLAISTIPNWNATIFSLEYEARRVRDDIRYAQALSVATGTRYRFVSSSGSSYSIVNESGTAIILPSGNTTLTLSTGISFGAFSNLPGNLISFDSQGVPYVTSSLPGTALASTAIIPVTNGSTTKSIQILPQTGYVGLT